MTSAEDVVSIAQSRMEAAKPSAAGAVATWFIDNRAVLLPWARAVLGTVSRAGTVLSVETAPAIVSQLIGRLEQARSEQAVWGKKYQKVLELFVRSILEIPQGPNLLASSAASVDWPRTEAERGRINVLAAQIASRSAVPEPMEREILKRFTGFGGLSLAKLAPKLPEGLVPDSKSLVDEFYTPPEVCDAIARVVAELRPGLSGVALEPAAGIGRFIGAFSARPDFRALRWVAVEYSKLSFSILTKLYPSATATNQPFEEWVVDNWNEYAGRISLVCTNPPYGRRGANKTIDPDRSYRVDTAYVYFVMRAFDSLMPGGIGVAIVPNGFLTGKGPQFRSVRERILKRHHLIGAYRLPSSIYLGADIVTDISIWSARAGELSDLAPGDEEIAAGRYFELFPNYVLGAEKTSARGRYEVSGDFTELPPLVAREECTSCTVTHYRKPIAAQVAPEDLLTPRLKVAAQLAERVSRYLDLTASAREVDQANAADLHPELVRAVEDWQRWNAEQTGKLAPAEDREMVNAANSVAVLAALLSVFDPAGRLKPEFQAKPSYTPSYQGLQTVVAQAEWLYEKRRELVPKELLRLRNQSDDTGDTEESLVLELASQGWAEDWRDDGTSTWIPPADYYSGDLWPKFRRAKAIGTERAKRQVARLLELAGTSTLEEASPTLRDPWIPANVVQQFLQETLRLEDGVPPLHWHRSMLKVVGLDYAELYKQPEPLQQVLGYINHDLGYFSVGYEKQSDPSTGEEETAQQALDRARLAYGKKRTEEFRKWLGENPTAAAEVLESYSLAYRGYVLPTFPPDPIPIARWGHRVSLRPHQRSAARRLIHNNGGLAALDVGVGKTYTGIATLAYLRQIGRARRPVIIVPNTIVWKWMREILRALPDYRVVVIGAEEYLGKGGIPRSRLDERSERLQKWSEFKLGLYDVAIVSFSTFSRVTVTEESLRQFLEETPPVMRDVGLKSDDLSEELSNLQKLYTDREQLRQKIARLQEKQATETLKPEEAKQLSGAEEKAKKLDTRLGRLQSVADRITAAVDPSERHRAILQESINEWVAEAKEEQLGDGIEWESLKVDLLILDEAQNMKNLWPVGRREGGVPKYLGAIAEGSDRAMAFAIRAFLVQKETGGSGVVLLSATPAKNSPLEFFTLLGFVDHYVWTKRGILDPDYFIDRYLKLEMRTSLKPNGKIENRTAVVGFVQLPELRDIINKYGEFKTAQEVGLKLPEAKQKNEFIPMSEEQVAKYRVLRSKYEDIVSSREGMKEKHKLLGLLQKMALVALHPELEQQPEDGWTWARAGSAVKNRASPKLLRAIELVKERPNCGHIIFCDNVAVHRWLFDLLVEAGIGPERIAVLNAERAKTSLARQEIADGFNGTPTIINPDTGRVEQEGIPPKYDIVIANAIAYEGIDLQVRTCRVYHLDLPYEPATLQQRNGRAVRQFNTEAVVEIKYLLSERSYDAVKLTLITGKLRWMSDILKSTDRETSNPAADMDLSSDDFLLMLADDPESAKQALEEIKRKNELERKAQAAFQAWLRVKLLIGKIELTATLYSESAKEQARAEALQIWTYLSAVPADAWPWADVVQAVFTGIPATTIALVEKDSGRQSFRLVWEGLSLPVDSEKRMVFGKLVNGYFSYRWIGDHVWRRSIDGKSEWGWLSQVTPSDYSLGQVDDSAQWEDSLSKAIGQLAWNRRGLLELGLAAAPDPWAADVWQRFGPQIVASLSQRNMRIPTRKEDTVSFDLRPKPEDVLPPTNAGFAELMKRVAAGRFKWGDVQDGAKPWWDRDFPRGLADERVLADVTRLDASLVRMRIESTYRSYAVASLPGGGWILVTAGNQVEELDAGVFTNLDAAKLAGRWLSQVYSEEGVFDLDDRKKETLRWLQGQSDLPTLAALQAKYGRTV